MRSSVTPWSGSWDGGMGGAGGVGGVVVISLPLKETLRRRARLPQDDCRSADRTAPCSLSVPAPCRRLFARQSPCYLAPHRYTVSGGCLYCLSLLQVPHTFAHLI